MADQLPDLATVRRGLAAVSNNDNLSAPQRLHVAAYSLADAMLLLLPPDRPGWHSVPDQAPVDGEWNVGSDQISVDPTAAGSVRIHDTVLRATWSVSVAEARHYAAALLSAAARAEQAANNLTQEAPCPSSTTSTGPTSTELS